MIEKVLTSALASQSATLAVVDVLWRYRSGIAEIDERSAPTRIVLVDDHAIVRSALRTVESRRAHIQQKAGTTTRAELVAYACEVGLLEAPRQP